MERLFYMSSQKIYPSPPSQNEENKKYFPYNHRLRTKRQKQASQMNGTVFQKDWTPHMEHFILTFYHQECWHHLNSAGIPPSASWAWFIFFTTFFYMCSGEALKVHKSTRMSCYFPKEFVKPPKDTLSTRGKLHDNLAAKITC